MKNLETKLDNIINLLSEIREEQLQIKNDRLACSHETARIRGNIDRVNKIEAEKLLEITKGGK